MKLTKKVKELEKELFKQVEISQLNENLPKK